MALYHEDLGSKISAKIKIYILSRAESLYSLCNEIPCRTGKAQLDEVRVTLNNKLEDVKPIKRDPSPKHICVET